jgi:CopY/TcrY family copper transport repressor
MNTTDEIEISQSEWETMRVIWTLGEANSHQVIEVLANKLDWKTSTTKTYLGRLVKKGALGTTKNGREFIYRPLIEEQVAMDHATNTLFSHLCQHKVGATLSSLIEKIDLSKSDLAMLASVVEQKAENAPEKVQCNCLSNHCDGDCETA